MKSHDSTSRISPLSRFSDATLEGIVTYAKKCKSTSIVFRQVVIDEAQSASDILRQREKAAQASTATAEAQ